MSTPENENAVPPFSFTPQADIASYLERLCELTGAARDDVMDELLRPVLNQIFEEGQGEPLEKFFQLYEYDDQNEALEAVRRYDAFCEKYDGYHAPAKLRRTPKGRWEIVFKTRLPDRTIYA